MLSRRHGLIWVAIAFLISFGYGQFPDAEYCMVPCYRGQHTMCKYQPVGPNCENVKSLMNENGRMKILSLHNSFRNALAGGELKTAPASSNMRQLYWDLELEAIAERWALQCNASFNDDCRNVNRFSVGQIMSKSNIISRNANYYEALLTKLWFPEVENLNQAMITNYRQQREVKHIAQILSANTMRIGCADVLYSTIHEQKPVRVTVCNYGPIVPSNEAIYRIGKPCTECPLRTECRGDVGKYPHLCTELRNFDVIEPEKSFQVVQRDYDDEDINNIVVESNVFRKGKNDQVNERRQYHVERRPRPHLSMRRTSTTTWVPPAPEAPEIVEGGRALDNDQWNSDYGGEAGMADDGSGAPEPAPAAPGPGAPEKPAGAPAGPPKPPGAAGATKKIGGATGKGGKIEPRQQPSIPTLPSGFTIPGGPTASGPSLKPIDLLQYVIGHAIIALTTF